MYWCSALASENSFWKRIPQTALEADKYFLKEKKEISIRLESHKWAGEIWEVENTPQTAIPEPKHNQQGCDKIKFPKDSPLPFGEQHFRHLLFSVYTHLSIHVSCMLHIIYSPVVFCSSLNNCWFEQESGKWSRVQLNAKMSSQNFWKAKKLF